MRSEFTHKLALRKETIRSLTESELAAVAGGVGTFTAGSVSRITCQSSCCDTLTTVPVTRGATCAAPWQK